jgi:hypothetical protein
LEDKSYVKGTANWYSVRFTRTEGALEEKYLGSVKVRRRALEKQLEALAKSDGMADGRGVGCKEWAAWSGLQGVG